MALKLLAVLVQPIQSYKYWLYILTKLKRYSGSLLMLMLYILAKNKTKKQRPYFNAGEIRRGFCCKQCLSMTIQLTYITA